MVATFVDRLFELPVAAQLRVVGAMVDDILSGRDEAIAAVRAHAEAIGASVVLVGGVAVIAHGYPRPTKDRDFLVDHQHVNELANRLWDDPEWERLEIRQYAFLHKTSGIQVDFLASRALAQLGRPYYFPDADKVETKGEIEGVPVIAMHHLIWMKLLAGRMQDLADIMQLCKLHLGEIEPAKVFPATLDKEDNDLRVTLDDILKKAPIELANEQRLGQGIMPQPKQPE